jgi:hypothetical protein
MAEPQFLHEKYNLQYIFASLLTHVLYQATVRAVVPQNAILLVHPNKHVLFHFHISSRIIPLSRALAGSLKTKIKYDNYLFWDQRRDP